MSSESENEYVVIAYSLARFYTLGIFKAKTEQEAIDKAREEKKALVPSFMTLEAKLFKKGSKPSER